jgi:hypothetical protein
MPTRSYGVNISGPDPIPYRQRLRLEAYRTTQPNDSRVALEPRTYRHLGSVAARRQAGVSDERELDGTWIQPSRRAASRSESVGG